MGIESTFTDIELVQLPACAVKAKALGWRFVQLLATNTEEGIDLSYSFVHEGLLDTYRVRGVQKGTKVPSITGEFLSAFVFENEAHDLFGVEIENIAIDFQGNFYRLAQKEPMTVVTPEKLAEREKAKKLAAAKAAAAAKKAAEKAEGGEAADAGQAEPTLPPEVEAKLAKMDPEKAAKARAALLAKAAKEAGNE